MKYIFCIGSHLTFYIAHTIIKQNQFSKEDCILLCIRNYQIPSQYQSIYKNIIVTSYNIVGQQQSRVFRGWNVLQTFRNIHKFDKLVDQFLENDPFLFYTPVCSNDVASLAVSKKNCIGYYVIEDGLSSYRTENYKSFSGWRDIVYKLILYPFFYRIYAIKDYFISTSSPKFIGCIATMQQCFPLHQQFLQVIGIPFEKTDLGFVPDAVLSVDPLYLILNQEQLMDVYHKLSNYIHTHHYSLIAYKLHPIFYASNNEKEKMSILKIIKKCFFQDSLVELDQDVVLENVLMTYHSDFYSNSSAVALYGHAMGAKCYSFNPLIQQITCIREEIPLFDTIFIPITNNIIVDSSK